MENDLVKKLNEFEVNIKCLQTSLSSFKTEKKSGRIINKCDSELLKIQNQIKNILSLKLKNEKIKNRLLKSKKSYMLGSGHRCYKISNPTKYKNIKQMEKSNTKFIDDLRIKNKNDKFTDTIYDSLVTLSKNYPKFKPKPNNSANTISKSTLKQKQFFCQAFLNTLIPQLLDSKKVLETTWASKAKGDTKNLKESLTNSTSKNHFEFEDTFIKLRKKLDNMLNQLHNMNKSIIHQRDTFKQICLRIRIKQKQINETNLNTIQQLEDQISKAHECNQRLLQYVKAQNRPF